MGQLNELAGAAEQERLAQGGAATAATLKQGTPIPSSTGQSLGCVYFYNQPKQLGAKETVYLFGCMKTWADRPATEPVGSGLPGTKRWRLTSAIDVINFGTSQKT